MKTTPKKKHLTNASVLIISLIIAGILCLSLLSYLSLVNQQNVSVARSQAWNVALAAAEAGIEEGMAQLNVNGKTNYNASATANWGKAGTTYGPVTRALLVGSYSASIDAAGTFPVITSVGRTTVPPMAGTISRTVRVATKTTPAFSVAMAALQNISFKGNNIAVDSYDSSDPAYSTGRMYDPAKRKAGGDVASTDGLISVQNADVKGKVLTGPDAPIPSIGAMGSVGDLNWNTKGQIQPGWYGNDFNVEFPDVVLPDTSSWLNPTVLPGNTNYVLGSKGYIMPGSGDLSLANNKVLYVSGNAKLYVPGNVSMNSGAMIVIGPGASLKIYVAGASATFSKVNTAGDAATFQYFGLPTNLSVTWNGNDQYLGTIYAPEADFTLGGGGNNTMDYQGATVAKTVTMNGHFNFHYDENLINSGPTLGFRVASWKEL